MRKIAVLQSNYIPWKGYFDIIHDVDEFIFYDEVQYTKNDWRNRNKILVKDDEVWLTIPAGYDLSRKIYEVQIKDTKWQKKHFDTLYMAYHKAPFWKDYAPVMEEIYLKKEWEYLSELNRYVIETVSGLLGCHTVFSDSRQYESAGSGHEKLLRLLQSAGAEYYVSGPAAKDYIVAEDYEKAGIELVWKDYSGYPPYRQQAKEFHNNVSVLDLLFNTGEEAPYYIWGWRES